MGMSGPVNLHVVDSAVLRDEFSHKEGARRKRLAVASMGGSDSPAHLVGLGYHDGSRDEALRAALAQVAPIRAGAGDSVYLRVNSNSGDPYPYSTSPDTVAAIGGMLLDLGVKDIRIGDRSFWGDSDTVGNLRRNGIAAAARKLGTTAVVFDDGVEWVSLPPDTLPHWQGSVRIPRAVATATHFINLACVETHFIAHFTMSLKLCLGLVHADDRRRPGNLDTHVPDRLWSQIAEVNGHITPTLNVLDGVQAVITGGPTVSDRPPQAPPNWKPATASPGTFIVSADRIAADVTGVALLRTMCPRYEEVWARSPFKLPQIRAAVAAGGLGITSPDQLDLSGPTVPTLDVIRRKAIAD
jgi:uncharacterized protein (DUF362 family)